MEKIGTFYSASDSIDLTLFSAAHQIGEWTGKNGKTFIYGGANLGLMECVAKAVKESGGHVTGVVPSKLEGSGKASTYLDRVIHTCNLSDRRDIILQQSDVLVAFSSGTGTLDEIFHAMVAAFIGYHQKRVIFYSANGFYSPLSVVFSELQAKESARHSLSSHCEVANTFDELTTKM